MNIVRKGDATLAATLLLGYQEGFCVRDLCVLTGLPETSVVRRLCLASRHLLRSETVLLDPERALGVQWEYLVFEA